MSNVLKCRIQKCRLQKCRIEKFWIQKCPKCKMYKNAESFYFHGTKIIFVHPDTDSQVSKLYWHLINFNENSLN